MNKERLVIKNFGPIKSVDLDLGKMTILIGDQATGKSTIAKVLAVCRYFSYIIDCSIPFVYSTAFDDGLKEWGIYDLYNENSEIEYQCEEYHFKAKVIIKDWDNELDVDGNISSQTPTYAGFEIEYKHQSEKFKTLIDSLHKLMPEKPDNLSWWNWKVSSSFFELDVKQVMSNPFFLHTERGLQSLFSLGKNSVNNINDSLYNHFADLDHITKNFELAVKITPIDAEYKNENGIGYIKNINQDSFSRIGNAASGYQSIVPIVLAIKYYTEVERRKRTFIVEEPELNLFPKTQKKLMEFFVENINLNGHSFLLPTHSPYFLSAINDLLMAYKKGQKNEVEVEKIIKKESWLHPDDLSVYQLKEGEAFDIFDKKTGLIADNIIDEVSDEMNEEFDELLDIR